ncbi:MAG: hypothetical protein KDD43_14945, partial [Bdellovibrionales bacterium]|nr:hypothetical protein [Bdellovibrionales bacterium]
MSLLWDREKSIESLINEIKRYTDSSIYMDLTTGKYTIKPNRKTPPEEIGGLLVLDKHNCKVETISSPSLDELVNEVKVIWTDLDERKEKTVQVQELGLYQAQDKETISVEVNYKAINDGQLALKLATRDLKGLSYPLKIGALEANRVAYSLSPGGKFVLNWEPDGIYNLVCIVTAISYGTPRDNKIVIDFIQDISELGEVFYIDPATGFTPINTGAEIVDNYVLEEIPYWLNKAAGEGPEDYRPMIMAEDPTGTSKGFNLFYKEDPATFVQNNSVGQFCPVGRVLQAYPRTGPVDTSGNLLLIQPPENWLPYEDATDDEIRLSGVNLIYMNKELMAIKSSQILASGLLLVTEVWRGALDTTIKEHPVNSEVWFISSGVTTTKEHWETQPLTLTYRL